MADDGSAGFGQDRGGNEGFSGTPLWKIKDQMAAYREQALAQALAVSQAAEPAEPPNVLVDAASTGGPADSKQKPLVRHVLVKDLNRIAMRAKVDIPKGGIFKDKAPMGLYALFDGQSSAGSPDPSAAEFCARNFHTKLLDNLAQLPPDSASPTFVKAALIKTFEDLDIELLSTHLDVGGGCGAAVALLIGGFIFTAVLGRCCAVAADIVGAEFRPVLMGKVQRDIEQEDLVRIRRIGGHAANTEDGIVIHHPHGATSSVSRSLGDREWKTLDNGGLGNNCLIQSTPEVQSLELAGPLKHPFLILAGVPVANVLDASQLIVLAKEFPMQPRAACSEIIDKALEAYAGTSLHEQAQCTAVDVCFLPARSDAEKRALSSGQPATKKAKTATNISSIRLRHIHVKYSDPAQATKPVDNNRKPITRSRQDAEAMLRRAMKELAQALVDAKKRAISKVEKDGTETVVIQTPKFQALAKELSDCPTAQKGGAMCGDLGWLLPEQLLQMRGNFKENVEALRVGQWSDLTTSDQGLHLVQRIA